MLRVLWHNQGKEFMIAAVVFFAIFILLAIISIVFTVFAVSVGVNAISWSLTHLRIDRIEVLLFFLMALAATGFWILTTYIGHRLWTNLI